MSRKRLRALYRRGDQYGRSWSDDIGLPLSFRGWLRFMGYA